MNNTNIKTGLKALAIFFAGFCGIITSASALNYAYHEHEGFTVFCACVTLVLVLGGCGLAFRKFITDKLNND